MQKIKKMVTKRVSRKLDITKISKFLHKQGLEDSDIRKLMSQPRETYFGLSMAEFILLDEKRNSKIVLENLKGYYLGEIMGS